MKIISAVMLTLALVACGKKGSTAVDKKYADTAASFDELAKDLVGAIKAGKKADYEAMARAAMLPEPKKWFEATFQPDAAGRLLAEYEADKFKDLSAGYGDLHKMIVDQQRDTITTSRHDSADDDMATGHQANAIRMMKTPTALYRLQLTRADGEKSFSLWSFVFVDGKFRFIGKTKRSKEAEAGSGGVDSTVELLGELPIRRARELMKERSGEK